MVKVDGYEARDTIVDEVELKKNLFYNSSQIFASGCGGTGKVNVCYVKSEALAEGGESRLGNLLVKARTTQNIYIVLVGGNFKSDVRLLYV